MSLRERLAAGAAELGLPVGDEQLAQLLGYLDLIGKWNKVYNLTAVRDPDEMLTHHLLDSLAVVRPLVRQLGERPARLLDVGSGGGLPGVVLSIMLKELRVDCVDAVAKKAAFIQQAAAQLGLKNLRGLHRRVETISDAYDVVASRAFASLPDFVNWSRDALAEQGIWMAMKGKNPAEELAALPSGVEVFHVEQLAVPGLGAERCIVWMRQRGRPAP